MDPGVGHCLSPLVEPSVKPSEQPSEEPSEEPSEPRGDPLEAQDAQIAPSDEAHRKRICQSLSRSPLSSPSSSRCTPTPAFIGPLAGDNLKHTTARPRAASCRCAGGAYGGKTSTPRAHATWPASAPIQPQPRQRFKAARHRAKAIGEAARIPVRLEPLGSEWQRLSRLSSPILPRALPHASAAARSFADQSCSGR